MRSVSVESGRRQMLFQLQNKTSKTHRYKSHGDLALNDLPETDLSAFTKLVSITTLTKVTIPKSLRQLTAQLTLP